MKRALGSLVVLAHLRGQSRAGFADRSRIERARDRRVRAIVRHAALTVPYYSELLESLRIDWREIRTAADLDRLPITPRDAVRAAPDRFLTCSPRARGALGFLTSGSSGRPLEVRHDATSVLANIAYGERERAPVIALCGGAFRPKELHVGYETSNFRKVLAFYAAHTRLPRPRRESVAMTAPFEEIAAAINRVRPDVLTAYGGFLDAFFRWASAGGVGLHAPKVVMYVGETLAPDRRDWIERTMGSKVMSRYCAAEAFKIGYFCEERTGFHLHDDLCHTRVVAEGGGEARPGEPGEIVISNLVNTATVLLNYPMGDVAAWSLEPCPCGRRHRLLSEIHGRVEDVLPLSGGRQLHPRAVWAALKDDPQLLQYQLVQHAIDRFELKLATVREDAFEASRDRAARALAALLGADARIEVSRHADLGRGERAASGKFRAVESRVAARAAGDA